MSVRLALVALCLVPSLAGAHVYVNDASTVGDLVDATGATWCPSSVPGQDTSTCGTCAAPCASIRGALISNVLAPGDTVFINTGTYAARSNADYPEVVTSGQPGAPITFQGAADANGTPLAVLDGASLAYTCMWIRDASDIVVRDLECAATAAPSNPCNPPYGSGFLVSGTSTNVVFDGVWAHTGFDTQCNAGIDLISSGVTTGLLEIRNSRVYDSGHGIGVKTDAPVLVTGNVVSRNYRHGIFLYGSTVSGSRIISNNDIYENTRGGGNFAGIIVRATPDAILSSNRVHSNGYTGIRISCSVDSKNACTSPARRASIIGNTVHDNLRITASGGSEIRVDSCSTDPVVVQDNISVATHSGGLGALVVTAACAAVTTSNYNDLYTTTSGTLVEWSGMSYGTLSSYQAAASRDQNSISLDPLFVDGSNPTVAARNLRLRSQAGHWTGAAWALDPAATSPAIDAASPASSVADETFCHGGRRNLGAYGGSAIASRSYQRCGLAFTTPAQSLQPQQCSVAVTVSTQDTAATAAAVSSPITVSLTSSSTTLTFYSDPGCSTPITQALIPAGANTTTFYFHDTTVGAPTMTATAAGLLPASQSHQIQRQATQLAFTTSSQVVAAGGCSAETTVQTRDVQGAPAAVGSPTPISLSATSGTLAFFSDAACSNEITQSVIPAGADATSFYFLDTAAGTPTVTASSTGLTPASQQQSILPGPSARLVFTTAPQTVTAGTCSNAAQVQVQDDWGNAMTAPTNQVVSLTSTSTTLAFYSDATCSSPVSSATVAAGASTATFYFRDTLTGSPELSATLTSHAPATQTQNIVSGTLAALSFSSAPQSVIAGTCSGGITVRRQDAFGNDWAGNSPSDVVLSSSAATTSFFLDAACATATNSAQIPATETSATFYLRDTRLGSPMITVSSFGLGSAVQAQTVVAAPATSIAIVTAPQTIQSGDCSSPVQVQTQDPYGNRSAVSADVALTLAASTGTAALFVDPGCVTPTTTAVVPAGGAEVSFNFSDTTPGSMALTVSGLGAVTQTQIVTAGAAAALRVSTSNASFVAGAGESLLTVTAIDRHGNVIQTFDGSIALTTQGAGGTLTPGTPQVTVNGSTTWRFTSTTAGTFTFTAATPGVMDGSASIVVHAASPDHVRTTAEVARALAGDVIPLSHQVVDAYGNATPLQTALNLTADGNSCELSPAALQTTQSGATSTTVRCRSSGKVQVCATADTLTGAPECAQLDVELPESTLRVMITSADAESARVPGARVTFQLTLTNPSELHAEGLILRLSTEGVVLDEDPTKIALAGFAPGESVELHGTAFVSAAPGKQHAAVIAWLERRDSPASARAELRFDVQPLQSDMGCGCGATSSPVAAWGAVLLLCAFRAARRKRGQATFHEK